MIRLKAQNRQALIFAFRGCGVEFFKDTGHFATILADPPWLFANRTGKMAPEHKRLFRYIHRLSN